VTSLPLLFSDIYISRKKRDGDDGGSATTTADPGKDAKKLPPSKPKRTGCTLL